MKRKAKSAKRKTNSLYEGLQENIRNLQAPEIEVWENKFPDKIYTINLNIPEFTCICPKTGLPDFATIHIEYTPKEHCVELKSLKYYMNFYRDIGIFHEHVVNKVMEDFVRCVRPRYVKITGAFNPRGGIITTVIREYRRK